MKFLLSSIILVIPVLSTYHNCGNLVNGDLFTVSFSQLKPNINCSLIDSKCFEEIQETDEALFNLLSYCDGSDGKTYGNELSDLHFQRLLELPEALKLFERNENCSSIKSFKNVFSDKRDLYASVSVACFGKLKYPFMQFTADDLLKLNKEVWKVFKERGEQFESGLDIQVLEESILKRKTDFVQTVSKVFIYFPQVYIERGSAEMLTILYEEMSVIHRYLLKLLRRDIPVRVGTCSICLEESKLDHPLSCGHSFHKDCISPWLKASGNCPYCRKESLSSSIRDFLPHYRYSCDEGLVYEVELFLKFHPELLKAKSCIYRAVKRNHVELTAFLLRKDADLIDTVYENGTTILDVAIKSKSFQVLQLISKETDLLKKLTLKNVLDLALYEKMRNSLFQSEDEFRSYVQTRFGKLKHKDENSNNEFEDDFEVDTFRNCLIETINNQGLEQIKSLAEISTLLFPAPFVVFCTNAFSKAIQVKKLDILMFLINQRTDLLDSSVLELACSRGSPDIVEYLLRLNEKYNFRESIDDLLSFAFENEVLEDSIEIMKILRRFGAVSNNLPISNSKLDNLADVEYLFTHLIASNETKEKISINFSNQFDFQTAGLLDEYEESQNFDERLLAFRVLDSRYEKFMEFLKNPENNLLFRIEKAMNENDLRMVSKFLAFGIEEVELLRAAFKARNWSMLDYLYDKSYNLFELKEIFTKIHSEKLELFFRIDDQTKSEENLKLFKYFLKFLTTESINAFDSQGDTPLLQAASQGMTEKVRILLENGANPLLRNKKQENAFVVSEPFPDTFKALVDHDNRELNLVNFKISIIASSNKELMHKYILNDQEEAKEFIVYALKSGNLDMVKELLGTTVDLDKKDTNLDKEILEANE